MKKIDTEQLLQSIKQFYILKMPDQKLTKQILEILGIYDIVNLEFSLNKYQKFERDAAMRMIEKFLPGLISGNDQRWEKAKRELTDIYYEIPLNDEEVFL